MGRIDFYMRIIERFGAAGAVLTSGQAVTLRFPTGDRRSTQVTPHDQLVELVREAAPPNVLDAIDRNRTANFDIESGANRYTITVMPQRGAWQVSIDPYSGEAPESSEVTPPPVTPPAQGSGPKQATRVAQATPASPSYMPTQGSRPTPVPQRSQPRTTGSQSGVTPPPAPPPDDDTAMIVERGQYEAPSGTPRSSGSALLDLLTAHARAANASDLYMTSGSPAYMRVNGQLMATGSRSAIDGDLLSRELGIVAPPDARAAWQHKGTASFTYGDGMGRVRVTLTRDHRGPAAALRLLMGEPPTLEQLGLYEVDALLEDRGLILIGGPSGSGKTTTLAAMVRALGEHKRRVVAIEDAIEIVHVSPWISQRRIGEHVPDVRAGVEAAMAEGVDAIVIGAARDADRAGAVIEAAIGGHLVITTVVSPVAEVAIERLIDRLPESARQGARAVIQQMHLGTVAPVIGHDGERTFEVVFGNRR